MSSWNYVLSWAEHEIFFITSGADLVKKVCISFIYSEKQLKDIKIILTI